MNQLYLWCWAHQEELALLLVSVVSLYVCSLVLEFTNDRGINWWTVPTSALAVVLGIFSVILLFISLLSFLSWES